jgi:hypothetical protein
MINGLLTTGAPLDEIFGTAGENEGADGKEYGHDRPEKSHEDDTTSLFEHSDKDQVTVEGQSSFLNLCLL